MKKKNTIQIFILFTLAIAVFVSLFAFQLPHLQGDQILQISMIIGESNRTLWNNTRLGLEQAANELNAELRFLTLSHENDAKEQMEILKHEQKNGADAIIISPLDVEQLEHFIDNQLSLCPIISIDSPVENADLTISPNHTLLGQALAQAVQDTWQGETIVLLDNSDRRSGIRMRVDAAENTLAQYTIKRIELQKNPSESQILSILSQNAGCTFLIFDPYLTEIVAKYKTDFLIDIQIYAAGSSPYITNYLEKGAVNGIAAWSDYAIGYLAAKNAVYLAQNKKVDFSSDIPFKIIDGADMYAPENEKILFPVIS